MFIESSVGNFKMNLLPAFSSYEFNGRTLHVTLILHSSGGGPGGGGADIVYVLTLLFTINSNYFDNICKSHNDEFFMSS
jgi:hypothetical protein